MSFLGSLSESGSLFLLGGVLIGSAVVLRRLIVLFQPKQTTISEGKQTI
jgi:hypothetical protein